LCAGSLIFGNRQGANTGWGLLGWFWLPLFPMFVIFFISALADTNRPPFDLVRRNELVAGFHGGIGSAPYMMCMLGEYLAIGTMCAMSTSCSRRLSPPIPIWPLTLVPA